MYVVAEPEREQTTRRSFEVKTLCAYLAETVYYSLQQDTAEKKYKKVHGQAERYRETNFNSAIEVIDQQTRFADQERSKAAKQHSASIRKLQEVFVKYHKNLQSDLTEDLASSVTVGPAVTSDDIDSRLEKFRESLTISMEKKVVEKTEHNKQLLLQELESYISSMKTELDNATSRTGVLEKQLKESLVVQKRLEEHVSSLHRDFETEKASRMSIEQKLKEEMLCHRQENEKRLKGLENDTAQAGGISASEVNKKIAGLAKQIDSAERSIRNAEAKYQNQSSLQDRKSQSQTTKVGELSTRLLTIEARVNDFDKELSILKQDASKSPKTPPHTPTPNDSLHSGLQNAMAEVERLREEMASLQNASSEQQPPSAIDNHRVAMLEQCIAQTRNDCQTSFSRIASKFGELINKEQEVREQLDSRLQEVKKTVDSIDSNAIISSVDDRIRDLDSKYAATLAAQDGKVTVVSDLLSKTRADAKAAFEDYTMQLGNLTSWQNNWNTSELYLQIVNHINASYPQGVFNELSKVARRLEAVEVRVERSQDKTRSPIGGQQSLANMTPASSK